MKGKSTPAGFEHKWSQLTDTLFSIIRNLSTTNAKPYSFFVEGATQLHRPRKEEKQNRRNLHSQSKRRAKYHETLILIMAQSWRF